VKNLHKHQTHDLDLKRRLIGMNDKYLDDDWCVSDYNFIEDVKNKRLFGIFRG